MLKIPLGLYILSVKHYFLQDTTLQ